ncbi:FAD-dependent monooxygenase (plasmid) [Deinococcus sp. KNUC1210]|uniref:FAD-dependent oxidoreductase n=1 Tax=Deinococcus sp. KNUC1210 TaxID=2917691 RepID=UPI001EEF8D5E|nr:FAD-dependent monooxygenase [Deinococcus sp. KNUC1210]ULH14068.1 FAD-dependent monooxygenase [Deinococcus sp. KNUC1210]
MTADVLIVGAGPTGLAAALELARLGTRPRIIDRLPQPTPFSRAIGVNPRTLELLSPLGLDKVLLSAGHVLPRLNLRTPDRLVATVDFTRLHHQFNHLLALAQSDTERLLTERLAQEGIDVERGVELLSFTQDATGVTASLRNGDRESDVRSAYMLGADGSHSPVRTGLGIAMPGRTYEQPWSLADIRGEWPFERAAVQLIAQPGRAFLAFPFGVDLLRVVSSKGNVLEQLPPGTQVQEVVWHSEFKISARLADTYGRGRVYLAGDAAHLHSPVGARGMNLGIEDGILFARKLASGQLDTYRSDRRAVASHVVRLTEVQTRLVTTAVPLLRGVRDRMLPLALSLPPVRDVILREVSGLRSVRQGA